MTDLSWTDDLKLGIAAIDADHAETVALMAEMAAAPDDALPGLLATFESHCAQHFGRENTLMAEHGFFAEECHAAEHARVLDEMGAVRGRLEAGDLTAARSYVADDLPRWFVGHLNTMDTVTAHFLKQCGVA